MSLQEVSSAKSFDGFQKIFKHQSSTLKCEMKFGVYVPQSESADEKFPVLYYLSGLTCTEANFIEKSGFQRFASEHRIIVVNPDTSPRGVPIEGDSDSYDFGTGAGFYVDATTPKWSTNYQMYSYVTEELPKLIIESFPVNPEKQGIFGHSMGGHGALQIALKNPVYKSVSAFAPICNPSKTPWGIKAFTGYLGDDRSTWLQYDSVELAKKYAGPQIDILIDQGEADNFLIKGELCPDAFTAVQNVKINVVLKKRPGYDHGYYYIATFIEDHFRFHAQKLNA
ncbi:hypothetical protein QR680_000377 [Steinernema hermaphroditum]|uniref:S-formylglutathione hydrolase n=1 Tax=Steinernema hermaphroditum TaxID=289476 RepID=A0AA39LDH5_9BILA|nr:hypothetical protein QR680_000377 [Steinernema hermaphroditum]